MTTAKSGNPRGNPENLIKNCDRTPEERRKFASKAGKASGKSRQRKKLYREILDDLAGAKADKSCIMEAAQKMCKDGITVDEAFGIVAVAKALNGDFAFWKEIREIREGKEAQKLEVSAKVTLEDLIKKVEGKSDY